MLVFYIVSSLPGEHSDDNTLNYALYIFISAYLSMSISTSKPICKISYWPGCLHLVTALSGESPLKIFVSIGSVFCIKSPIFIIIGFNSGLRKMLVFSLTVFADMLNFIFLLTSLEYL